MPDVYAQRFELAATSADDLASAVREAVHEWLEGRWPSQVLPFGWEESATVQLADGTVTIWEPWRAGSRTFLDFTLRQPVGSSGPHEWRTRLSLLGEGTQGVLMLRIENNGPPLGQPNAVFTARPRLPLLLVKRCAVRVDHRRFDVTAKRVTGEAVRDLVRHELCDRGRAEPIVVVTPRDDGGFVIDPDEFASKCASTAMVFALQSPDDSWTITHEVGKTLSVFRGAMRVYLPRFGRDVDPTVHPLILPGRLSKPSEVGRLIQWLAALTVRRFEDDPRRLAWRDEMQLATTAKRQLREADLREAIARAESARDEAELAQILDQENALLRTDLASRGSTIEGLQRRIADLEGLVQRLDTKCRQLSYALSQAGGASEEEIGEDPLLTFEPQSVADAMLVALDQYHPKPLRILDKALRDAEEHEFGRPSELIAGLRALAQIAVEAGANQGRLGKPIRERAAELNIDFREGISASTKSSLRDQHRVVEEGHTYICEAHVALGGGRKEKGNLRIYVDVSYLSEGVIVVGRIGHMDTNRTD